MTAIRAQSGAETAAPALEPLLVELARPGRAGRHVRGGDDADRLIPEAFRRRVVAGMERIVEANPGGRVVVVSHGGVINAYAGHVLGITRPLWFEPAYASISRVMASRDGVRSVASLNETGHLRDR